MKIILVGASGTIGQAVAKQLSVRHEVVAVGRTSGDHKVDITSRDSIHSMFKEIGLFDALVCTAGDVHFGPLDKLTEEDCMVGIKSKLLGQVNLVLLGMDFIADHGSFTLTSGVLSEDPIPYGASASMVNAALEGFVLGASIEMQRGIRINAVSPNVLEESMDKIGDFFRGHVPVPADRAALAYSKSVEGLLTGKVIRAH